MNNWRKRKHCDSRCVRLGEINSLERRQNISKNRRGKGLGNRNGAWGGDSKCSICNREKVKLVYDHRHKDNKFRGWICFACNVALGLVNDDENTLRNLILYLNGNL